MALTIDPMRGPTVRFSGKHATQQVTEQLLSGPAIRRALKADTESPYLGDKTQLFMPGKPRNKTKQSLVDVLSRLARPMRWFDRSQGNDALHHEDAIMPDIQLDANGHRLSLSYAGAGAWGNVFKLRINDGEPMALKVFYQSAGTGRTTGRFAEAGRGLFATHHGFTKDAAKILMANPNDHWLLAEWITPEDSPKTRKGRPLTAGHFRFVDDFDGSHTNANRIGGIRIDYGTMFQPPKETLSWARDEREARPGEPEPFKFSRRPTFQEFQQAVSDPKTHFGPLQLTDVMAVLPNSDRFPAFHLGMKHPTLRKTDLGVHLLPVDDQPEAMWMMLDRPELTSDLMTLVNDLPREDRRIFKQALLKRPPGKAHYVIALNHDPEKQAHWAQRFFKQLLPDLSILVRPSTTLPDRSEPAAKAG